jgi:hypothetical protein
VKNSPMLRISSVPNHFSCRSPDEVPALAGRNPVAAVQITKTASRKTVPGFRERKCVRSIRATDSHAPDGTLWPIFAASVA